MAKLRLSEADLASILAGNPDIEMEDAGTLAEIDVQETAIEPYRYTRPILFAEDVPFPYPDVIVARKGAWSLPAFGLPWQAWLLLAFLMFFLWRAPILAFAVWMFLCFCTPVLSIGKGL